MVYSKWNPSTSKFVSTPEFEEYIDCFDATMEWRIFLILFLGNTWTYMNRGWFEYTPQGFRI